MAKIYDCQECRKKLKGSELILDKNCGNKLFCPNEECTEGIFEVYIDG